MQLDFNQFGDFPDAKTFLIQRAQLIESNNKQLADLHKKVKDSLLIMGDDTDDEIILHQMPLKALVFHDEDDRKGHINNTFVNFGRYYIDTVEVYYGEHIRSGEINAIKWVKLNLRGQQPEKSIKDFCKTNGFGGWDDENMSWGRNCLFVNKEEYLLFKETVTNLGIDLGVLQKKED